MEAETYGSGIDGECHEPPMPGRLAELVWLVEPPVSGRTACYTFLLFRIVKGSLAVL